MVTPARSAGEKHPHTTPPKPVHRLSSKTSLSQKNDEDDEEDAAVLSACAAVEDAAAEDHVIDMVNFSSALAKPFKRPRRS